MRRRFIAKNKRNISIILKVFIIFIIAMFALLKIMSFKLFDTNINFVSYIMESSNHLIVTDLSYSDKLTDFSILLTDLDLKKPDTLFKTNFIYKNNNLLNDSFDSILPFVQDLIQNCNKIIEPVSNINDNLPKVYIYNTHQTEGYVMENDEIHSLTPNVYEAANALKEMLNEKNINAIVEDGNISEYLNNNNLNYDDSYIASRYFLEKAIIEYPSIDIFIDLHRDALNHELATVEYEGKKYAKILFVVGLEHSNHQENLAFANELNNLFLNNYPFLTRGVLTKSGPLVNGIYNQDLSNKIILLEVGGNESTFDEVSNTLELVSNILYKKLGERNV